jgi:selenocysteine lyase/cysteine desulfurase
MTGVVNKFQRILGLKLHEKFRPLCDSQIIDRPIVFCSHMEHHSNQTSWLETIADVRIINANDEGLMDLQHLKNLLQEFKNRKVKIAAITSCSNVTGIKTPYYEVAKLMHENGGLCFVDFAASAPYININMRPDDELEHLDAIYFSPHKFLGGPGSSGILIFDQKLYNNKIPDNPGGGTVDWTNPWGEHKYLEQIEAREDGGTPGFLQTIRVALCIKLKEKMGVKNILQREEEMMEILWNGMAKIAGLHILADNIPQRLGIISFYIEDLHYNLGVKLLNDRFGIQVRGGCSCAGTYGHYLLHVSHEKSKKITNQINIGNLLEKPGWIRLSINPVMTNEELFIILDSIHQLSKNHKEWKKDYRYQLNTNEFIHNTNPTNENKLTKDWFEIDLT